MSEVNISVAKGSEVSDAISKYILEAVSSTSDILHNIAQLSSRAQKLIKMSDQLKELVGKFKI